MPPLPLNAIISTWIITQMLDLSLLEFQSHLNQYGDFSPAPKFTPKMDFKHFSLPILISLNSLDLSIFKQFTIWISLMTYLVKGACICHPIHVTFRFSLDTYPMLSFLYMKFKSKEPGSFSGLYTFTRIPKLFAHVCVCRNNHDLHNANLKNN